MANDTQSRLLLLLALITSLVVACGGEGEAGAGRLRVVATTTQIGDFARNVGGDRIALTVLLRPNQDAHDFEPSPSQIRALSRAALVLRNGIGLDDFVSGTLGAAAGARVAVVTAGIALRGPPAASDGGPDGAGGGDPHVWFSVENAGKMVENVAAALSAADPSGAPTYGANAARYLAEQQGLDREVRAQVARVPPACRKLVSNHDTLGYYAEAYGFTIVGAVIPSVSTEAKPSAADVAAIVRRIREEKVPAIFAETSVNPALIRQVAREAGVRVVDDLYGDSLGPKGSDGDTYVKMMRANTRKIVEALSGCSV